MKSTGIIRKLDELGRIVLPKELRDNFNIEEKDPLEIFTDGPYILLKKHEPNCAFCGNTKKLTEHEGKLICEKCIQKLIKLNEVV